MEQQERALAAYVESVRDEPGTLAVVVVGSVAQGRERPDSDVDVYLVVEEERFAAETAAGRFAWVDRWGLDYPGSYVDIKLASPDYLTRAIERADDPTRASFVGARVMLDKTEAIADQVAAIVTLPDQVWQKRVTAYRAQARLYGGYFLKQGDQLGDQFLVQHAGVHLALAAGRIALAQHHRFFSGQKYLTATLAELDLPVRFETTWRHVVQAPSAAVGQHLLEAIDVWLGPPEDFDLQLSRFIADNELAWLNDTIPPEFW